MPPITSKTADFAHLFELFDKLASRRSRHAENDEPRTMDEDNHTLSVPTELEPVFRNLATLVTPRSSSRKGGRRNTVAVPSGSSSDLDSHSDKESVANFPLGKKQYPFKFKMMLHKLYELEEWRKKVTEVLENSQKDFKPLSEKKNVTEPEKSDATMRGDDSANRVHFEAESRIGSAGKRAAGRPRSHTVASPGGKGKEIQRSLGSRPTPSPRDDERAVKKRCVGRRKSMGGMKDGEKAVWVYDAAVASTEINERLSAFDATVPPVTSRYGALQQGGHARGASSRRRTSSTVTPVAKGLQGERRKRRATSVAVVRCP